MAHGDLPAAGHLDAGLIDEPTPLHPADEPVAISLALDESVKALDYLQDAGLRSDEARNWDRLLKQLAGSDAFAKGHALTLLKDPVNGDLRGFRYNLDDRIAINEQSYGQGVLRGSQELIKYDFRPVAVSFRLQNDFWREATRHDLPRSIIDTLDYAFADHGLARLPRGSEIKLIYQEKISRDGTARVPTGIQAASISFGRHTVSAFAFRDESGQPRLYDANGVALGPEALRFPLNFQFISSGFSPHRYHPILHQYRAHEGVDLVAQYGTPVKAVADGQIAESGWCGELGRCVRIRHEGGIVSIYGHLSRIAQGIEDGRSVRVGQIIGQVGSSGLSTGPHLHYAIEKDGQYVNPLSQSLGVHREISPRLRGLFDTFKHEYITTLNRLPLVGHYQVTMTGSPISSGSGVIATAPSAPRKIVETQAPSMRVERTATTTIIDGRASIMR